MKLDEKRLALKKAVRIPRELLDDEEMMYFESVEYLVHHLRAVVHALRILGEPKTDDDFIELFGKTEEELFREREAAYRCNRYISYDDCEFYQTIIENELAHAV